MNVDKVADVIMINLPNSFTEDVANTQGSVSNPEVIMILKGE